MTQIYSLSFDTTKLTKGLHRDIESKNIALPIGLYFEIQKNSVQLGKLWLCLFFQRGDHL